MAKYLGTAVLNKEGEIGCLVTNDFHSVANIILISVLQNEAIKMNCAYRSTKEPLLIVSKL